MSCIWDERATTKEDRMRSRYLEMSSVGQLLAETMGRPGLLVLCILERGIDGGDADCSDDEFGGGGGRAEVETRSWIVEDTYCW